MKGRIWLDISLVSAWLLSWAILLLFIPVTIF